MSLEKDFLHLLLTTTQKQGRALLQTVTIDQTRTLAEIAYNLPRLVDLGPEQDFITYLGKQNHTLVYKKRIVSKYRNRLLRVLIAHKDRLLEL